MSREVHTERSRAFITFDLDVTLFASKYYGVRIPWIAGEKGKQAWVTFLQHIKIEAEIQGIELYFGIITAKPSADELVFAAIDAFTDFLDNNVYKRYSFCIDDCSIR